MPPVLSFSPQDFMHPQHIDGMLNVLRPIIRNKAGARKRLERYWSDKIAIVWTVEQIHRAANERELALTNAEALQVLKHLWDLHNPQYGIKWSDIPDFIHEYVLGRKLTKRELHNFVHREILTINTPKRRKK
jgi:hypothetical protein